MSDLDEYETNINQDLDKIQKELDGLQKKDANSTKTTIKKL